MKTRFLKNTATIAIVLLGLFFTMNDGKNEVIANKHKQLDADLIKAAQGFKKIRFLPKEYTERVTDTILASGYHVTIKYKSLMNQSIIKKDLLTNGSIDTYYRKFESQITVTKNETLLFEIELPFENRHEKKILQYVWLDEMASSTENLVINYAMYNPSNNQYSDYQIHIDKQGNARYIDLDNTV